MPSSNTYSYSVSRDKIVRLAMLNIGKLDENEVPTPQEMTDCCDFLNMLVKQWQGKADFAPGLKTWTRRHGHLFLSGITGQYNLGPTATGWTNSYLQTTTTAPVTTGATVVHVTSSTGMTVGDNFGVDLDAGTIYWTKISLINGLNITITGTIPTTASSGSAIYSYTTTAQQPIVIETAFLRDFLGNDTPLKLMTLQEYDFLPNKASPTYLSDPAAIYYEFQLGNGVLNTDVAGSNDLTKHICMTYMESIQDFNNPNDTPEYPQEWYLPLALGLSKVIASMFGVAWTSLQESTYLTALAIAQRKEPAREILYFQCGAD